MKRFLRLKEDGKRRFIGKTKGFYSQLGYEGKIFVYRRNFLYMMSRELYREQILFGSVLTCKEKLIS